MSDFEQQVETEAARLRAQSAESTIRRQSFESAINRELAEEEEVFFRTTRDAGVLLTTRGVAPAVSKRKVTYGTRPRVFGRLIGRLPVESDIAISGWVLHQETHSGSGAGKAPDNRRWVTGVLFDGSGLVYSFVDEQIKSRLESYEHVIQELRLPGAYSAEQVAIRSRASQEAVLSVTAKSLAQSD